MLFRSLVNGTFVSVTGGTLYANYIYQLQATNPVLPGTSSLTFAVAYPTSAAGVGFIQAGTGAVARTAQAKMRERVTASDFAGGDLGVQIQNAGTIAGNLCNASPAADGVPPLLALMEAPVSLVFLALVFAISPVLSYSVLLSVTVPVLGEQLVDSFTWNREIVPSATITVNWSSLVSVPPRPPGLIP